jgi:hypothetical protein
MTTPTQPKLTPTQRSVVIAMNRGAVLGLCIIGNGSAGVKHPHRKLKRIRVATVYGLLRRGAIMFKKQESLTKFFKLTQLGAKLSKGDGNGNV